MKKFAVMGVLVLAAASAATGVYLTQVAPEVSACERIQDLCGMEEDAFAQCVEDLGELKKSGRHAEKLDECVASADTCGEATGCVAGTGLRVMAGEVGDFFKGIGKSWK